jgi:hypothetical protein
MNAQIEATRRVNSEGPTAEATALLETGPGRDLLLAHLAADARLKPAVRRRPDDATRPRPV